MTVKGLRLHPSSDTNICLGRLAFDQRPAKTSEATGLHVSKRGRRPEVPRLHPGLPGTLPLTHSQHQRGPFNSPALGDLSCLSQLGSCPQGLCVLSFHPGLPLCSGHPPPPGQAQDSRHTNLPGIKESFVPSHPQRLGKAASTPAGSKALQLLGHTHTHPWEVMWKAASQHPRAPLLLNPQNTAAPREAPSSVRHGPLDWTPIPVLSHIISRQHTVQPGHSQ